MGWVWMGGGGLFVWCGVGKGEVSWERVSRLSPFQVWWVGVVRGGIFQVNYLITVAMSMTEFAFKLPTMITNLGFIVKSVAIPSKSIQIVQKDSCSTTEKHACVRACKRIDRRLLVCACRYIRRQLLRRRDEVAAGKLGIFLEGEGLGWRCFFPFLMGAWRGGGVQGAGKRERCVGRVWHLTQPRSSGPFWSFKDVLKPRHCGWDAEDVHMMQACSLGMEGPKSHAVPAHPCTAFPTPHSTPLSDATGTYGSGSVVVIIITGSIAIHTIIAVIVIIADDQLGPVTTQELIDGYLLPLQADDWVRALHVMHATLHMHGAGRTIPAWVHLAGGTPPNGLCWAGILGANNTRCAGW